jgi:hypothetical protein
MLREHQSLAVNSSRLGQEINTTVKRRKRSTEVKYSAPLPVQNKGHFICRIPACIHSSGDVALDDSLLKAI